MNGNKNQQTLEFTGSGGEYFKIWIVNILLSILTLGIYSAWAKVRKKRYFYSNTVLMGSTFDYLADPLKILKGRIIAVVILVLYSFAGGISPVVGGILALALFVLMPWIVIKSLTFNAYYSAYRNIRFDFNATYGSAFVVFVLYPILIVFSLGLAYPFIIKKINEFIIDHSAYGTSNFKFNATGGQFYIVFLKALAMYSVVSTILMGAVYFIIGDDLFSLMEGDVSGINEIALISVLVLSLPAFLFIFAYVYVAMINLVFNELTLQEHQFSCSLSVGKMCWIIFSNMLMVSFTFGLMIPWAKIRVTRYRLSCLSINVQGNPEDFIAAEKKRSSAIGEEVGEMFDMDIGL